MEEQERQEEGRRNSGAIQAGHKQAKESRKPGEAGKNQGGNRSSEKGGDRRGQHFSSCHD